MNTKALSVLEFDKIKNMLSELCRTDGARRKALAVEPCGDIVRVKRFLSQTSEAKKLAGIKEMPSFDGVHDIRESLERAEKSAVLSPGELLRISAVLRCSAGLCDYIRGERNFEVSIEEIFGRLSPNRTLENRISRAIISEDMISDEASPTLSDIRRKIRGVNLKINEILQKYTSGGAMSKYLQENIVTTRGGRFVIPVKSEYKSEVKGLVHDVSSSGATLFIEPSAVVDANNELRTLESLEKHEIERILAELSALCADSADALRRDYLNICELSFIFAKAELSFKMDAIEPEITDERYLSLVKARHPLLDAERVVPITVSLGRDYSMLVITGPNTGGKTVALKTIGLFSAMALSGLHIPAGEGSVVCMFDNIFSDIGDEQSIEQSLSTFSAHMVGIVDIIGKMTDESLVLFDELGAGTDPVEGAALAESILEEVRSVGALSAATTHYAELKAYAVETDGVCNASCEFDVETLAPTYRLVIGAPGKSNAFAISEKLGLPEHIVKRAAEYIDSSSKSFENVIEKLESERVRLSGERERAEAARVESERMKRETEGRLEKELKEARREAERQRKQAAAVLKGARATSDYIISELEKIRRERNSSDFEKKLSEAKRAVRQRLREAGDEIDPVDTEYAADYVLPRPLKKGDSVIHKTLGTKGTLLSEPDKSGIVEIQMGIIRSRVNVSDLILDEKNSAEEKTKKNASSYSAALTRSLSPELDVRGEIGEDAWLAVDKYLDEATVASLKSVTVIHGKGTGALRAAIWKRLKNDKRVKSFRAGQYGEGDHGVTVIELK